MTPTEQQKAILECRENLVVIAAPGSGKTFVLSEKIKNDIKELLDYQGIIAISYTNKASLELKNRSLANGISPKSSFFGTIDKFCIQDIIIPFGSLMQEKKTFDNLIIRSMNNSERSQLGQVEKREKIEYNHMDIILSLLEANIILPHFRKGAEFERHIAMKVALRVVLSFRNQFYLSRNIGWTS